MDISKMLSRATVLLVAGALVPAFASPTRAQDSYYDDDYGPSRVARISYIDGDVSVFEPQAEDWERADVNMPIFEGTELYVGPDSRAEIGLGARSYLRVTNGADVTLSEFADGWAQISVASGTAVLSVSSNDRRNQYSMSAPAAAVTPTDAGLFRIDVADNGDTWVTINQGTADISTTAGSFAAYDGDLVSASYEDAYSVDVTADAARWSRDEFDEWVSDRDQVYDDYYRRDQPREVIALGDRDDIYGLAELAQYGEWRAFGNDYAWQPSYASDPNWSPYQDGYWDYSTVSGYTWVSNEPWGWAPYHYGRWDFDDRNGWLWYPTDDSQRSFNNYQTARYRWKPALVYVWQPPGSNEYAWVPLARGERYVPFSSSRVVAARTSRPPVAESFRPRNLVARKGIVTLSPTALASRQKPARATRVTVEKVAPPTPTATATAPPVVLTGPARNPAAVAPARVRPSTAIRTRAVVVDNAAEVKAPKPKTQADQALRTQRKAERAERRAERRKLQVERQPAGQTAAPVTAQPTGQPTTQPGPTVRPNRGVNAGQPGRRGGRKLEPADGTTGTPGPRTTTGAPGQRRTTRPATTPTDDAPVTTPRRTVTPAPNGQTAAPADQPPADERGRGRGQRKNRNRNQPPNPDQPPPTDETKTPPPSPQR